MSTSRVLLAALAFLVACKPVPPDAPEGAEAGTRFLMSSFYADDLTIGAGLTGLMNWYDDEGATIDGETPELDATADFTLTPLAAEDLAPTQTSTTDRPLGEVPGVMAVSTLTGCTFEQVEAFGGRPDQDVVFEGEWAHYARTYETDRAAYDAAVADDDFPAIDAALDPTSADFSETAGALMLTSNPLGTDEVGVVLDYTLNLHFRHGRYLIQDEARRAVVILTWQPEPTEGAGGNNALHQTWGIDALVEVDGGVRRFVATWNDIETALDVEEILVRTQVNRINDFSERLVELCADPSLLPDE